MPASSTHVFCSPDDIGIRLRLWLDLRSLAFLSNTTAGSTFQPLLTTLSFTPIHHEKKQSTRHHLLLNLVVLTKAIKPTPQNSKRSGSSASASSQSPQRRYSPSPRDPRTRRCDDGARAHAFVTRVANVDHRHARYPFRCVSVGSSKMKEQSRRDYIRGLHEVTDEADIVLVLDVHDLTGAAPTSRGGNVQFREGGKAARVCVHKNDVQAMDPEVAEAKAEDARGP